MKSRSFSACLAFGLVLFLLGAYVPTFVFSSAQSLPVITPTSPAFIFLGYGPSTLSPAQQGSPIYTTNDSLWIYSSLNQTARVILTNPYENTSIETALAPSTATSIYTFHNIDQSEVWLLIVALQNSSSYTIPIPLVSSSENQASAALSEYSIQNGQINLGFSVNAPDSYDLEGCLSSTQSNGTISLSEPSNIGSGQIAISIDQGNNTATVSQRGSVSSTFSFWFDLEYSYGYASSLPNETISRTLPISRSSTILANSSGTFEVLLPILNSLRVGRYLVRGFFDSSSGFETSETRALLLAGGQWFWLSSCDPFSIVGSTFSNQVSLAQAPSTWPSFLYFMYQSQGIESYSVVPLQINLARLDFLGQPGNVQLSDFSYSISNNSDIEASGTFSGSVYVIAKNFPVSLTVTPSLGTEFLTPIEVNISKALTDSQFFIPIGKLTVIVLNNSQADVGAVVQITNSQGASISSDIPSSGNTSFSLPSAYYNVTISKNGVSKIANATVIDGSDTILQFTFVTSGIPTSYLELLFVPLIVGIGLNLWTWIIGSRRSRFKLK